MWWIIGIILYTLFVISLYKILNIAISSDIDSVNETDFVNEINNEHFFKHEYRYEY